MLNQTYHEDSMPRGVLEGTMNSSPLIRRLYHGFMSFGGWLVGCRSLSGAVALVLLGGVFHARAQWLTQTNVIKPGWNAVYLFVNASGQTLDTLVGANPANPITQVWEWNVAPSPAQYISTPQLPLSTGSQWLTWIRSGGATQNGLQQLSPNAAYLVYSSASTNYTWGVQGKPVPPAYNWNMAGLNFIGFPTTYANPPAFNTFFAYGGVTASFPIFGYPGGQASSYYPQPLIPSVTPVVRGQAYWLGAATGSNNTYFGPFEIILPNPSGIDFTNTGTQISLHIANNTTTNLTVSVGMIPSETPQYGTGNLAGVPPLLVRGSTVNITNLSYSCVTLGTGNTPATTNAPAATNACSWTLAPCGQIGSDVVIVMGVNRYAMSGPPGTEYVGILRFTDSLGLSQVDVPVAATVGSTAGLWVGSASVSQVANYLKNYATNSDGSLLVNPATNWIAQGTNWYPYYTADQLVTNCTTTTTTTTVSITTNLTVTSLATNFSVVSTNAWLVVTNELTIYYAYTNVVFDLELVPPYYTNDAQGNLIWYTQMFTNLQTAASTTNIFSLITNYVAAVTANNTQVITTNLVAVQYNITNIVVTNALFEGPVTNTTLLIYGGSTNLSVTNLIGLANNLYVTNQVAGWLVSSNVSVASTPASSVSVVFSSVTNVIRAYTNGSLVTVNVTNAAGARACNENLLLTYNFTTNNFTTNWVYNVQTTSVTNGLPAVTNIATVYSTNISGGSGSGSSLALFVRSTNVFMVVSTNLVLASGGNYQVTGVNTNLGAVMSAFPLRLILFYDGTNCALLQRVFWGLNTASNRVVSTVQSALDPNQYSSARRISAVHLPWSAANAPWPFAGQLRQGGTVSGTVSDPYDDQTSNPFLHTYHPDHNNLDSSYGNELPRGAESYDLVRTITLAMAPPGTDFVSLTTANSSLSGAYAETINVVGVAGAARSFHVAGTFTLNQLSTISTLTTH